MESPRVAIVTLLKLAMLTMALTGCGLKGDERAPLVTGQTPTADSVDNPTASTVSLTFSEALRTGALTTDSLVLSTNGSSVAGELGYDPSTQSLEFEPSAPLALGTTYQASYGPGIADLAGNPVAAGSWDFTTVDGTWQAAEQLSVSATTGQRAVVDVDDNGYGIAVWLEYDGVYDAVHAAHYVPGVGWNTPGIIDIFATGDAISLALEVNPTTGQAIVAWTESNAGVLEVWATFYDPAVGWGTPARANDGSSNSAAGTISVFVDDQGYATVAWGEIDGGITQIWANQLDPVLGWGTAALVQTDLTFTAGTPLLRGNGDGQLALAWVQGNAGAAANVYFSSFTPGAGWSAPQELDTTTDTAGAVAMAINSTGNILLLFIQGTAASGYDLYYRWYTPGGSWTAPVEVASGGGNIFTNVQLALNDDDHAISVFAIGGVGVQNNLYSAEFAGAGGWEAATLFEQVAGNDVLFPSLRRNALGVIQVAWIETQGAVDTATESYLRQRRFRPGLGWEAPQTLFNEAAELSVSPQVALANSGETLLVWQQQDAVPNTRIMQLRFSE